MVAARAVYEIIVIPRSRGARAWAWFKSLFWGAITWGGVTPALDIEQATLVRRATREKMLDMDDRGSWSGRDFIGELGGDLASRDVEAFERKWLGR